MLDNPKEEKFEKEESLLFSVKAGKSAGLKEPTISPLIPPLKITASFWIFSAALLQTN